MHPGGCGARACAAATRARVPSRGGRRIRAGETADRSASASIGAERRLDPARIRDSRRSMGAAGRRAEQAVERSAESRCRIQTVIELQIEHGFSLARRRLGPGPCGARGDRREGHAAVARLNARRAVEGSMPRRVRSASRSRRAGPASTAASSCATNGALTPALERPAATARAVTRVQSPRSPTRRTRHSRASGPHDGRSGGRRFRSSRRRRENTLECRVAVDHGAVHHFGRRQIELRHARIIGAAYGIAPPQFRRQIP